MRIEYIDPEYDAVRLVDAHEAPCYDAYQRRWVVHTVARMQAGLCEARNGNEQLAPERLPKTKYYGEKVDRIYEEIRRNNAPMTARELAERLDYTIATAQTTLNRYDGRRFQIAYTRDSPGGQRYYWTIIEEQT